MTTPLTYEQWYCKLRPLVLVPDHTRQLVHVDNDEYNKMQYQEYLKDWKNINVEQMQIAQDIIKAISKSKTN